LYRDRLAAVLDLFDDSIPSPGSVILNVGTIDPLVAGRAASYGCTVERIRPDRLTGAGKTAPGKVSPSVILALKLLPWNRDARPALAALARLMGPSTTIILQFHNAARAGRLLDPRMNPLTGSVLRAARSSVDALMGRTRAYHPSLPLTHTAGEVESLLAAEGLSPVARRNVGYGPFTLLGKHVVPDDLGCWIHRSLGDFSDQSAPWLGRFCSYVVMAVRKSGAGNA
jgi:hypothetical protein